MITTKELVNGASREWPDGRWYPCLPIPNTSWPSRVRDAWAVLTGKAEVIIDHPRKGEAVR